MHFLVIGRGLKVGTPVGHQVLPFLMYEKELRQRLGVTVQVVTALTIDEWERIARETPADVTFVMPEGVAPPDEVAAAFERLSRDRACEKLVFLDYTAWTSSPFFGSLPYVDLHLKRQALRDRSAYLGTYSGGSPLTEYLSTQMGIDLEGWHVGAPPPSLELLQQKMAVGWNLGVVPKYRRVLRLTDRVTLPWRLRPVAVHRRVGRVSHNNKIEWYQRYRSVGLGHLAELQKARRLRMTGLGRVSPKLFQAEMMLSRLVFSPFGWGEVCFRDYEAVTAGSLLLKPSMSHLETYPNIYVEGETYLATAWDFSDMAEKVEQSLANPKVSARMARAAREHLRDYYEKGGFVDQVEEILTRLYGATPRPASTATQSPSPASSARSR